MKNARISVGVHHANRIHQTGFAERFASLARKAAESLF
jgi:hypothetical protein